MNAPNTQLRQLAEPDDFGSNFEMMGEMAVAGAHAPPAVLGGDGKNGMALSGLGLALTTPIIAARDPNRIMQQLKTLAAANGDRYVYSWPVKNRKENRVDEVEGPTIKLANDLARVYGNCFAGVVDVKDVRDDGGNACWEFISMFFDRETGFMMARSFRQRKGQDTGMKDQGRALDMVYQIGCSKAIRNVVCNALESYKDFMMAEAKKNLVEWVSKNHDKAQKYIDDACAQFNIDLDRIEAVVGRKRADWLVRDVTKVLMQLRSVKDGFASPDEIFPKGEAVAEVRKRKQAERAQEGPEGDGKEAARDQTEKAAGRKLSETAPETEIPTRTHDEKALKDSLAAFAGEYGIKLDRRKSVADLQKEVAQIRDGTHPDLPKDEPDEQASSGLPPHDPKTGEVREEDPPKLQGGLDFTE